MVLSLVTAGCDRRRACRRSGHSAARQPLGQHSAAKLRLAHVDRRHAQPGGRRRHGPVRGGLRRPAARPAGLHGGQRRPRRPRPPTRFSTSPRNSTGTPRAAPTPAATPASRSRSRAATPITYGGSIWAGGLTSVLEADYYWMYDDGYSGSSTTNSACSLSDPLRMLGSPRTSFCTGSPTARAALRSCQWARLPPPRTRPRLHRGHLRQLVLATDGHHRQLEPARQQAVQSGSVTVGHLTRPPTAPATGRPRPTARWRALRIGPELRLAERSDQLAHRGHGPDARRQGLLAGRLPTAASSASATPASTGRPVRSTSTSPSSASAPTPNGKGYWMVASDGGIFSFGNAQFYGSMGGKPLNQPIVGLAADPTTGGYWEVASDGGVSSYHAPFYGSTGSIHLNKPIVGMEASPSGQGYRFVASDGGIFTYGQAPFEGSTGSSAAWPHRWWAWPPTTPPTATGWRRPTAASSPSAAPPTSAGSSAHRADGRGGPAPRRPLPFLGDPAPGWYKRCLSKS